jgi:hypothetical protein
MTLGSCLSSYTAQNIGAGKKERIPLGFRTGLKLSELTALPFVILYFVFSRQMMGLFLGAESAERRNGIFENCIAVVFYDCDQADDRWNYPRLRSDDLFCGCNSSGSYFENRICVGFDKKLWKHRDLDGMAIWLDRSDYINIDLL